MIRTTTTTPRNTIHRSTRINRSNIIDSNTISRINATGRVEPSLALLLLLLLLGPLHDRAHAQATPAASVPAIVAPSYQGFQLPRLGGSLQFALSASEILSTGFYANSGTYSSTSVSGDLAYLSTSKARPFSMVYSGGYIASTSGKPSAVFQNLSLAQAFLTRSGNFLLADSVSYLPETPSNGLSGIPGVGDLGVVSVPTGPATPQGILTNYASRVSNITSASAQRRLVGSTSIQGSGSLIVERFLGNGNSGIDNTQESVSAGPSFRIDARNTIGASYGYSRSTYTGSQFSFVSQSVLVDYSHQFTRKFAMDVSAGPQRTTSSTAGAGSPMINVAANLGLSYVTKAASASLGYSRGTNSGSGVVQGAISDSVHADARRMLNRLWFASVSANYARTSSLTLLTPTSFSTQTFSGAVQASRAVGRYLSAYVSYTAQRQSIDAAAPTLNAFSGLSQIIGIGLTFSPGSIRLGQR